MCDNKIRGLIAPLYLFFLFLIYIYYLYEQSQEIIERWGDSNINNNDRFVIDGYDNKTIESVVKNLVDIVSKYIPKTDNRIYGYIGNNNK